MICRPEDGDIETPEELEEKVPGEEEAEGVEEGEKGPVDYNALDYETMDGAGSDKDEDRFGKNGTTAAVIEKPECEVVPTGNGAVEEEFVTEIIAKEKLQGKLLTVYGEAYTVCSTTDLPYSGSDLGDHFE